MSTQNLRLTFAELMLEIGEEDKSLVVIVGDISHGILKPFAEKFSDRYFNIGICEPATVNIAAGISKVGLNPVIHTIAPFLTERSYEQIKLDLGYQDLPANIISVGGSFDYSRLGCSHHCYTDVSLFAHLEKSQIFLPGSSTEFRHLFKSNYNKNKINYFRLTEYPHNIELNSELVSSGKGLKLKSGDDLSLICLGPKLKQAHEASVILFDDYNISVDLIYINSFKPFDSKLILDSVKKTKNFISIEELSHHGGLYSRCLEALAGTSFNLSKQLAVDDFIKGYGSYEELTDKANLSTSDIIKASLDILDKK